MVARRDNAREEQPLRLELIARVRREIQLGVYETPEKWEIALERLFADVEALEEDAAR